MSLCKVGEYVFLMSIICVHFMLISCESVRFHSDFPILDSFSDDTGFPHPRDFLHYDHRIYERMYVNRWLNKLLMNWDRFGVLSGHDRIKSEFSRIVESPNVDLERLDEIFSDILTSGDIHRDPGIVENLLRTLGCTMEVVLVISIVTILSFIILFRYPKTSFSVIVLGISVAWNWIRLYNRKLAEKPYLVESLRHANECKPSQLTFFEVVTLYVRSFFSGSTNCQAYYEALFVSPVWEVSLSEAIANAVACVICEPLKVVAETLKKCGQLLFSDMSGLQLVITLAVILIVSLMVFKYSFSFGWGFVSLRPCLKLNAPSGQNPIFSLLKKALSSFISPPPATREGQVESRPATEQGVAASRPDPELSQRESADRCALKTKEMVHRRKDSMHSSVSVPTSQNSNHLTQPSPFGSSTPLVQTSGSKETTHAQVSENQSSVSVIKTTMCDSSNTTVQFRGNKNEISHARAPVSPKSTVPQCSCHQNSVSPIETGMTPSLVSNELQYDIHCSKYKKSKFDYPCSNSDEPLSTPPLVVNHPIPIVPRSGTENSIAAHSTSMSRKSVVQISGNRNLVQCVQTATSNNPLRETTAQRAENQLLISLIKHAIHCNPDITLQLLDLLKQHQSNCRSKFPISSVVRTSVSHEPIIP